MSHVFVSYSRKDSETVDHIVARLNKDGLDVWIDREDIKGGELWHESIVEAIDRAYAFVLMLSPSSLASDNVRKEVDVAEGSKRELVPVLLAAVKLPLPAKLRYQLAGIQWIEYYRNPKAKYRGLVEVLQAYRQKLGTDQAPVTREVELVLTGLDLSKLGDEEKEQLEGKVLDLIANFTNTPRADLDLVRMAPGSVHAFVNMPADAAYQLKTAALNRNPRLIKFGIEALRLSSDRHFVFLKTGQIAALKSGKSGGRWFTGGGALMIALILSALIITVGLPLASTYVSSFFATATPTATNTFTPAPSDTPTTTPTLTPTLSPTRTPTETPTSQGPITYGPDPEDFPPGINPLTGRPACDSSLLKLPAVLVSITNFPPSARPQAGLSFSPIIFEIFISEGTTRLLAVFYGECPHAIFPDASGALADQVGPVRSGRLPYVHIRNLFQWSCLVYASATKELRELLRGCKIVYGRDAGDINSAFFDVTDMKEIAQANVRPSQPFNYTGNLFSDALPSGGQPADLLNVYYSYLNQARWTYDSHSGKYVRSENYPATPEQFTPATDRLTGQDLAFSNVIVMFAEHIVIEPTIIDIDMRIGTSGDAYLLRDGQVFRIRWTTVSGEYEQKTGLRRPIRFTDEAGNPIALKPGNTWVHVMTPYSSSVDEQSPDEWLARFRPPAGAK